MDESRDPQDDSLRYAPHVDTTSFFVRIKVQRVTTKDHFSLELRLKPSDCGDGADGGILAHCKLPAFDCSAGQAHIVSKG